MSNHRLCSVEMPWHLKSHSPHNVLRQEAVYHHGTSRILWELEFVPMTVMDS